MISWIQINFQKHFRSIFLTLLAVLVISFVFTIGASPGIGEAGHRTFSQPYFGYDLAKRDDTDRIFGDAGLSVTLQIGYPALDDSQLQQYALTRVAGLHLADQLGLPAPTAAELAEHVRGLRMFTGANGEFDVTRYNTFRDQLKTNPRVTEADVSRVIADDVRYENVQKLLAGPGYVLPEDVKFQLELVDTKWTLNLALIDFASYQPAINPSATELETYYSQNSFRYEKAAQVRVEAIDFKASDYASQITVTDEQARAYYDANPARFPKTDADAPSVDLSLTGNKTDTADDFNAVKARVIATMKLEEARRLATKAASKLSLDLFEAKATPETIAGLLQSRSLTARAVAPFSLDEIPDALGGEPASATLSKLDKDNLVSDAVTTATGATVMVWIETIPSHTPLLAEVRDQVAKDFTAAERRKRFTAYGASLKTSLEAKLKTGTSFEDAVKAAATDVKIETKTFGPFTRREPPKDIPSAALAPLDTLQKGQISPMTLSQGQGVIVFAAAQEKPDLTPGSDAYAKMQTQMALALASGSGGSYLQDLVSKELGANATLVQ